MALSGVCFFVAVTELNCMLATMFFAAMAGMALVGLWKILAHELIYNPYRGTVEDEMPSIRMWRIE